jgi:hypothetical protein
MTDKTPTKDVSQMLNGDNNHYNVTDSLRKDNTRYFDVRGNAELFKTAKSLVRNTTPYTVVQSRVSEATGRFHLEIVRQEN